MVAGIDFPSLFERDNFTSRRTVRKDGESAERITWLGRIDSGKENSAGKDAGLLGM